MYVKHLLPPPRTPQLPTPRFLLKKSETRFEMTPYFLRGGGGAGDDGVTLKTLFFVFSYQIRLTKKICGSVMTENCRRSPGQTWTATLYALGLKKWYFYIFPDSEYYKCNSILRYSAQPGKQLSPTKQNQQ